MAEVAGVVLDRSCGESQFVRGDRVVLLEFNAEEHLFRVVSEEEFLGKSLK